MASNLLNKKFEYWQHQLLDLGKRNKMINYRETKRSTLKLVEPSFDELYNRIAINEETLTFQRAIDKETDIRVFSILSLLENLSAPLPVTIGDIKTEDSIIERQRTLQNLRSKSRLAQEEQGTNILYLSFGFIEWRDGKGTSAHIVKSPLILVPATLTLEALNSPYTLSKHEDDIVVNPTLTYYFKTEYGIELPNFDVEKETIDEYLKNLEEIADQRGWRIIREVSLGLLSFLKITMYNDLMINENRIKNNPVIRAMAGDSSEANDIPDELRSFELDSIKTQDCYQVMSADSSQQDAILYSKNNISFVMQGPPGTGKSQTITNIIAEALADGKKILFVSEKMAALQVVYRRLEEAHLADFCLPLHSYKANKKEILEQIGANLKLKQTKVKDSAINNLEELLAIRKELNNYASELHKINPKLNFSCYEVYSKLAGLEDLPLLSFSIDNILEISQSDLQVYLNKIKAYSLSLSRLNYFVKNNPWEGLSSRDTSYEFTSKLTSELTSLSSALTIIIENIELINECPNLLNSLDFSDTSDLISMLTAISDMPIIPENWLSLKNPHDLILDAKKAKQLCDNYLTLKAQIKNIFSDDVFSFDYIEWKEKLLTIVDGFIALPLVPETDAVTCINNRIHVSKTVEAIKNELLCINRSFSEINERMGSDFRSNLINSNNVRTIISHLDKKVQIPSEWFNLNISELETTISEANHIASTIKSNSESISKSFSESSLNINEENFFKNIIEQTDILTRYNTWKNDLEKTSKEVLSLSLSYSLKESDIINNQENYYKIFSTLLNSANEIINEFNLCNKKLGLNFSASADNFQIIYQLIIFIKKINTIPQNWFSNSFNKFNILFNEALENYNLINQYRADILEDWETDIFSLDYKPILLRYKTDYTSVFKVFSKQYKADRKIIQALSRKTIKLPKDNVVTEILSKLKRYYESVEWFDTHSDELYAAFGSYFSGINTDWEKIKLTISTKIEIEKLLEQNFTEEFSVFLSTDHAQDVISIDNSIKNIKTAYETIDSCTREIKLTEKFNEINSSLISDFETYVEKLKNVCDITHLLDIFIEDTFGITDTKLIREYIINNRNEVTINELIVAIDSYAKNSVSLNSNKTSYQNMLGSYYDGLDTNWDLIKNNLEISKNIRAIFNDETPQIIKESFSPLSSFVTDDVQKLLQTINNSAERIDVLIKESPVTLSIDCNKDDLYNVAIEIEKCINFLYKISSQYDLLTPFLINKEESARNVFDAINDLESYKKVANKIAERNDEYSNRYKRFYKYTDTDWDKIIELLNKLTTIQKSNLYAILVTAINTPDERKTLYKEACKSIYIHYETSKKALNWIKQQFNTDIAFDSMNIKILLDRIDNCIKNIDLFSPWVDYLESKEECSKHNLSDLLSQIEEIECYKDIENIFLKSFYTMWIGAVCAKSDSVRRFRKNAHNERISKFIELDKLQLLIAQMRIREKLIENLPAESRLVKATDEIAILNKELNKKRNIMPLRKLFKLIPNLLLKLKPCLMMSPLSVSYFLETEAYHFDLVIFDEASQIFPEDAIGAIFRGSQVIIAGDSKQLPPTNFFSASTNNFDNDYDTNEEEDLEILVSDSILEEATAVLPNRTLLWHYRSKDEGLIAFSNREIYKNSLITFPNTNNNIPDMGVEYIYVSDGYYEGSGKNYNIREAQKCVMLVLDHIHKYPNRSLGIIAFSEKQQNAIEKAIIEFREQMPHYEWFFDESREEPFFVKNLENVQGDERDTIIFSICYAKDINGKMHMRFGPLGHSGGERRLNVAVTRAKCNIKLVGSILPSDIDLNRTNSEGVRMLKSYIEFARTGTSTLKPAEKDITYESNDDFCDVIASFIISKGYKIKRHVGCSDYRIDIAIINPKNEREFVAGIECDGNSYIQARTARDRDHLRKSILENMGWNLYRVWSTAWYQNPKAEAKSLLDFIESLLISDDDSSHEIKESNDKEDEIKIEDIASETEKKELKISIDNPYNFAYYEESNWLETPRSGSRDNLTRIAENVIHAVSIEEPIHLEQLYKRLGPSFTAGKATEGVRRSIDNAIEQRLKGKVTVDNERFVRLLPLNPIKVRIPKSYDTPRPMEYICTEEISMAMIQIIKNSFGISEEDLSAECSRIFGFERRGPKIKAKTDSAIKYLVENQKIKIIDGKVQLIGEHL